MKLRISTIEVSNPFWVEVRVTDADRLLTFDEFVSRVCRPALRCIWDKFTYVDEVASLRQEARDLGLIDPDEPK